jgi:hypothetical protein
MCVRSAALDSVSRITDDFHVRHLLHEAIQVFDGHIPTGGRISGSISCDGAFIRVKIVSKRGACRQFVKTGLQRLYGLSTAGNKGVSFLARLAKERITRHDCPLVTTSLRPDLSPSEKVGGEQWDVR